MRSEILFNGKFLAAPPTGVHRVAGELIAGIDRILADPSRRGCDASWQIILPPDAKRLLPLSRISSRRSGPMTWQFWEQLELPLRARNRTLVNLCNLSPLIGVRSSTMVHDAQVFMSPDS